MHNQEYELKLCHSKILSRIQVQEWYYPYHHGTDIQLERIHRVLRNSPVVYSISSPLTHHP